MPESSCSYAYSTPRSPLIKHQLGYPNSNVFDTQKASSTRSNRRSYLPSNSSLAWLGRAGCQKNISPNICSSRCNFPSMTTTLHTAYRHITHGHQFKALPLSKLDLHRPSSFLLCHIYKEDSIYPSIIYNMTNKPKSRRSNKVVNARNGASALADSSSGPNTQAVTPAQVSVSAEEVCRLIPCSRPRPCRGYIPLFRVNLLIPLAIKAVGKLQFYNTYNR